MTCSLVRAFAIVPLVLPFNAIALQAQDSSTPQTSKSAPASRVARLEATELTSKIHYVRLILKGSLHDAAKGVADPPAPDPPPILVAQCSLRPNGKYFLEIFTSFGGANDPGFYPPWRPASPQDLFPPTTQKVKITMEFLGYTQVKPFRRQWEIPVETPSLYRYNSPGSGSPNLEEFSYFLRYMLSLPTLRLTLGNRSTEFVTTQFLADIRNEPLCRAAAL